jgi:hypothetical protein
MNYSLEIHLSSGARYFKVHDGRFSHALNETSKPKNKTEAPQNSFVLTMLYIGKSNFVHVSVFHQLEILIK